MNEVEESQNGIQTMKKKQLYYKSETISWKGVGWY